METRGCISVSGHGVARFGVRACMLCGGIRCSLASVFQGQKKEEKKVEVAYHGDRKNPTGEPTTPSLQRRSARADGWATSDGGCRSRESERQCVTLCDVCGCGVVALGRAPHTPEFRAKKKHERTRRMPVVGITRPFHGGLCSRTCSRGHVAGGAYTRERERGVKR